MSESFDYPPGRWYTAIFQRQSRRRFRNEPLNEKDSRRLQKVCEHFRPFPDARAVLVRGNAEDVFRGILGSYGKIVGASSYLAFLGDMRSPYVQENVGYTGEGLILEATAMGLGSCWVGGFFYPRQVSRRIDMGPEEKVIAISPVGPSPEDYSFDEKIMKGFVRSHRRKALSSLVKGPVETLWAKAALEAARLAPSAVNRQPWRFRLKDESITICTDSRRDSSKISKRLDCGIAMLHLELGARWAGAPVRLENLNPPDVARLSL
jgi:nitroreductase